MNKYAVGEPIRSLSVHGLIDSWTMDVYGVEYRVVVAVGTGDEALVCMYHEAGATPGAKSKSGWGTMRRGRAGGVVTARFIREQFGFGSVESEHLAVLVASALGRPYSEREVLPEGP